MSWHLESQLKKKMILKCCDDSYPWRCGLYLRKLGLSIRHEQGAVAGQVV